VPFGVPQYKPVVVNPAVSGLADGAVERRDAPRHLRIRHERRGIRAYVSRERRLEFRAIEKQETVLRRQNRGHGRPRRRVLDQRGNRFAAVRSKGGDVDQCRDLWIGACLRDDDAAATLGIPPSTLESKIKQLKIEKTRFTTAS
jgi:hypothetical protein